MKPSRDRHRLATAITDHILKQVSSDDRGANVATYSDPSLPLAPAVVPAIADFILSAP